jgi:hypothetical protein
MTKPSVHTFRIGPLQIAWTWDWNRKLVAFTRGQPRIQRITHAEFERIRLGAQTAIEKEHSK